MLVKISLKVLIAQFVPRFEPSIVLALLLDGVVGKMYKSVVEIRE